MSLPSVFGTVLKGSALASPHCWGNVWGKWSVGRKIIQAEMQMSPQPLLWGCQKFTGNFVLTKTIPWWDKVAFGSCGSLWFTSKVISNSPAVSHQVMRSGKLRRLEKGIWVGEKERTHQLSAPSKILLFLVHKINSLEISEVILGVFWGFGNLQKDHYGQGLSWKNNCLIVLVVFTSSWYMTES